MNTDVKPAASPERAVDPEQHQGLPRKATRHMSDADQAWADQLALDAAPDQRSAQPDINQWLPSQHPFTLLAQQTGGGKPSDAVADNAYALPDRPAADDDGCQAGVASTSGVATGLNRVAEAAGAPPAAAHTPEARLQEMQTLLLQMTSGIEINRGRTEFTLSLSHAMFSGSRLKVRSAGQGVQVDYSSSSAAETDWFRNHGAELAQRLSAKLNCAVTVQAEQTGEGGPPRGID